VTNDEVTMSAEPGPPEPQVLSDEEVISRVRAGDPALFEVLMRRYNQRLFRVACSILKDEDEAEDVMQAAYLIAYSRLGQLEDAARFATWLARIALHEALARARRSKRLTTIDVPETEQRPELTAPGLDPEQETLTSELRGALEQCVDALPRTYRVVFVLRELEGLSTAEAAACLGLSEDVVRTRLHRARGLLRTGLLARSGGREALPFGGPRCDRVVAAVLGQLLHGQSQVAQQPLPPA
jgi:RNA polymerase sigma-70 factor (ECF subfamily)